METNGCDEIRKNRRQQELSQEYMAYELGISQKAYSDIENGKTRLSSVTLHRIAGILGVKPSAVCPIAALCQCSEELSLKHRELITYLQKRNIEFPERLI